MKKEWDMKEEFKKYFSDIVRDIVQNLESHDAPTVVIEWIQKSLGYNVFGGKLNRGLAVPETLALLKGRLLSEDEKRTAFIVGWCVELMQAFFLIADDVMDQSYTRRGRKCWFRLDGVGTSAMNDAVLLESCIYLLLKKHFLSEPYYHHLVDLCHEMVWITELGQQMDLITTPEHKVDLSLFSYEKYRWIVINKTSFYSFYLPVAAAFYLHGIENHEVHEQAKGILLPLGEYFQAQDDYLDCFGDPQITGKTGTDIQDNKCSWLINKAIEFANNEQLKELQMNYGSKEEHRIAKVKQIYEELGLPEKYAEYEQEMYKNISEMISAVDDKTLNPDIFTLLLNKIHKRNK